MQIIPWLTIFGAWTGLGLIFVGIGSLFRRALRAPANGAEGLLLSVWLGWICTLFFLQIWHLFLPVGPLTIVVVAAFGVIGLAVGGTRPWLNVSRGATRNPLLMVLGLLLCLWVANRAQSATVFGDTGGYYIPTVRWLVEYPIVPGLA